MSVGELGCCFSQRSCRPQDVLYVNSGSGLYVRSNLRNEGIVYVLMIHTCVTIDLCEKGHKPLSLILTFESQGHQSTDQTPPPESQPETATILNVISLP